jgi:DNA polymerase-3 subunit delta
VLFGLAVVFGPFLVRAKPVRERIGSFSRPLLVISVDVILFANMMNMISLWTKSIFTTILVLLLHGASVDKRRGLYKAVQKNGVVVDSPLVRDYELPQWISSYYEGRGLRIAPDAAALLAESTGTDLGRIAVETDILLKNLPEGASAVSADDIEKNVGISREYSVFELTRALSYRQADKAVRIATRMGGMPRFALPAAVSALFTHFYRILKYEALLSQGGRPSQEEKARVLGVSPYFFREYDEAVRNYPLPRCMAVISLLNEYDFKGKGGNVSAETEAGDLLVELTAAILGV